MKKILGLVILMTCTTIIQLTGQNLISDVSGKWLIVKYQSKMKAEGRSGTLEFLHNGTFRSEGIYFGTQTGVFRTDENRSVLIIEIENGITEWTASVKNNVLRLKTVRGKSPKIYLTLMRV